MTLPAKKRLAHSEVWLVLVWIMLAFLVDTSVQAIQTNISSICSPSDPVPLVVKGTATYVCVNVNDAYRTLFTPVADKYTVLRITDCGYLLCKVFAFVDL
eukprot:jgi/Phyca11/131889/e_gw1.119.42.1